MSDTPIPIKHITIIVTITFNSTKNVFYFDLNAQVTIRTILLK